jgi:adenosine kinase
VTTLRAAEKFEQSYLSSPALAPLIDAAKIFYVEGFFLTHGAESVLELAKKAANAGKVCSIYYRWTMLAYSNPRYLP